jgi:hypothetical protein
MNEEPGAATTIKEEIYNVDQGAFSLPPRTPIRRSISRRMSDFFSV